MGDTIGAETIAECFNEVIRQAKASGTVKNEVGSIDSTIVESHANRFRLWFEDQQKARKRTPMERNFSVAKRCHRLEKTISWGLDAFSIQFDFALIAWNAKCWVKQLLNRPCWEWKTKCA